MSLCLLLSSTTTLWAQTESGQFVLASNLDITAPLIKHTLPDAPRLAGESHVVAAEIIDDRAVESAQIYYKSSTTPVYSPANMIASADGKTWSAVIDTSSDDSHVWYYLVAGDAAGNRVQKGTQRAPLMLQLQQTNIFPNVSETTSNNANRWIAVGLGVLLAGALIATSKSDEKAPTCCQVTIDFPNVGE